MMDLSYPETSNEIDLGVLHYCLNASEKIADCEYAAAHFVTKGFVSATTSIGDSFLRAVLHTGSLLSGDHANSMDPRIISGEEEINAVLRPHAFGGALNLKFLALLSNEVNSSLVTYGNIRLGGVKIDKMSSIFFELNSSYSMELN